MTRTQTSLIPTFAIGFALCAASVDAAVIFSNLGPGDSFSAIGRYVTGATSGFGDNDAGSPFEPTVTATLDILEVALSYGGGPNSMELWLMSDSGGWPGTVVEAFSLTNLPTTTGCPPVCALPPLTMASSTIHPTLLAGTTYWLVASVSGSTTASFQLNTTGHLGEALRLNGGPWAHWATPEASAFRVSGTPVGAPVPEPSELLLFSGLVSGWWLRRCGRCRGVNSA